MLSPVPLAGALLPRGLSHAVQSLLQQVLPEGLSHLSQRIHCRRSDNIIDMQQPGGSGGGSSSCRDLGAGEEPLTGVARLAVDALLGGVADGPVSVHEEAVTQRVAEPLHGRRDAAAGRQAGLAGAAQEHPLWEKNTTGRRGMKSNVRSLCGGVKDEVK